MVMLLWLWWRHHPRLRLWWRHQPRLLRRHQPRLRLRLRRRHQRRLRLLVVVLKSVEVVVRLRGWHQPAVRVAVLLLLVVIHLPFVLTAAARQPRAETGGIKAPAGGENGQNTTSDESLLSNIQCARSQTLFTKEVSATKYKKSY